MKDEPGGNDEDARGGDWVREFLQDNQNYRVLARKQAGVLWPPALLFGLTGAVGATLVSSYWLCIAWWIVMITVAPFLLGWTYHQLERVGLPATSSRTITVLSVAWCLLGVALIIGSALWTPSLRLALPWLTLTPVWCWLGHRYRSTGAVTVGISIAGLVLLASFSSHPALLTHLAGCLILLVAFILFYRKTSRRSAASR